MSEEPPCRWNLEWAEVAPAASVLFHVWHDGTELAWAESAWATMGAAGLTGYYDGIRLTRAKVRLLALALIYRDFCQIGCDEGYDASWFVCEEGAELNLSNVRLGQLIGPDLDADQINAEDSDLAESALFTLTDEARPLICRALVTAYGGASQLAEALFATSRQPCATEGDEEEEQERDLFDENLNDAARVVDWIAHGMKRL